MYSVQAQMLYEFEKQDLHMQIMPSDHLEVFYCGNLLQEWTGQGGSTMLLHINQDNEEHQARPIFHCFTLSTSWNNLMLVLRPQYAVLYITIMYIPCTILLNICSTISIYVGSVHKVMQFIFLLHWTSQHMFDNDYLYVGSIYSEQCNI